MSIGVNVAYAGNKTDAKVAYVLKSLKVDKAKKDKLTPILSEYYAEVSSAKKEYKDLKNKLEDAEFNGKLTAEDCDKLFETKQAFDSQEAAIRKKYYQKFKSVLTVQEAYQAIKLCNDKVK